MVWAIHRRHLLDRGSHGAAGADRDDRRLSARKVDSSKPAARLATPITEPGETASVGTTSQTRKENLSMSRAANSMQAAIGCSSLKVISRSERQSDTRRWAVARLTFSFFAISSWVLPAM
jgi:hypothetical protein